MIPTIYARVGALVFALALGVPHVAEAACAWVLWWSSTQGKFGESVVKQGPERSDAYSNERDCKAARQVELQKHFLMALAPSPNAVLTSHPSPSGENGIVTYFKNATGDIKFFMTTRFECLPDTIDPRVPKESGR